MTSIEPFRYFSMSYTFSTLPLSKGRPNYGNDDAGTAHARSNFGRRNNEIYLSTT